jgi:hypothetical protein
MLTEADVKKYQKLYKARFGTELDRDDAYTELSLLVRQFQIIYQPITKADVDAIETKDREYDNADANGKKDTSRK